MSELAETEMPAFKPVEWDLPPAVGLAAGVVTLGALGYIIYKFLQPDDEEDNEED